MKKYKDTKIVINKMLSKRFFRIVGTISSLFLLFIIILPIWQLLPDIESQVAIPLHYNIYFGVDWYGSWWWIFTIPIVGVIIFISNFILSILMWNKDKVLSYFLWITVLVAELVLMISMIFVVLLNLTYI